MADASAAHLDLGGASQCLSLLAELLDLAYETRQALVPCDRLMLALFDPRRGVLRIDWMRCEHPRPRIKADFEFPIAQSTLQGVIEDRQPFIIRDVVETTSERPSAVLTDVLVEDRILSSLAVPIVRQGEAIGVLYFSSAETEAFHSSHIPAAESLARRVARALSECDACSRSGTEALARVAPQSGIIAQAIDDTPSGRPLVEVAAAVERAHQEVRLISEIIEKINAGMLFHEVLDHVYDSFRSFLPVDRLGFARVDDDGARVRAIWGRNDTSTVHLPVGYNVPLASTSLARMLDSDEPRVLNDLEAYLALHPDSDSSRRIVDEGMRSSLTCPLVANGKPIGFLFFSSRERGAYRPSHVDIFKRVAGHVAVTVEKGWIHKHLVEAREKSDDLLHNIPPPAIAERLMGGSGLIADHHPEVTVMFADLVGFSTLAARMSPNEVVSMLNRIFSAFDDLTEAAGVEKIKTIGDAYLAVGGLPEPRPDHAQAVLQVARGMLDVTSRVRGSFNEPIQVRIGMHSGPVVAGVIGKRKFGYDLWGDTVNVASRMQSHGLPDRIQVTAHTRQLLGDSADFLPRGLVNVKGARSIESFLLVDPR